MPRTMDEMGDRPERLCGLIEDAQNVLLLLLVALLRHGATTGLFHRHGNLFGGVSAAHVIDGDVMAACGRKLCCRRANAAAAAGCNQQNGWRHFAQKTNLLQRLCGRIRQPGEKRIKSEVASRMVAAQEPCGDEINSQRA